jgi:hypothetical protein
MNRRVTDGPQDEYRRQLDDLHRRTNWEHGPASEPDPDWESGGGDLPATLRGLLDAVLRRPRGRLPRR